MRIPPFLLSVLIIASLASSAAAQVHKKLPLSPIILSAKSVYFDNQTAVAAVGDKALAQLKKWGRFQIVQDRKQADLIILLSADPYKGGYIITAGGQTGTIEKNGHLQEDPVPNYMPLAPVRDVSLTVIDPKTGENLWSDSHQWGGLLTGFNSAGERLVKKLQKQTKK